MAAPVDGGETEEGFPSELQDRLTAFDQSLSNIENVFQPLLSTPLSDVHAKLEALDKAKVDLVGVYAINSLFWMYLNVKGENPQQHGIKQELDRIRNYMGRIKEIQEKEKQPKLDKEASKRFVRSALWQAAHNKAKQKKERESLGGTSASESPSATPRTTQQDWQQAIPPWKKQKGSEVTDDDPKTPVQQQMQRDWEQCTPPWKKHKSNEKQKKKKKHK